MKQALHYLLIIPLLLFFNSQAVFSQSTIPNLATVNVNDLSDTQIKMLLQRSQSAGENDKDLLQSARAAGMPEEQVTLLQNRINSIRANNSVTTADTVRQSPRRLNYRVDTAYSRSRILDAFTPQVFGSDLFNGTTTTFEPNLRLATPLNYVIGPDDQLNINVYGNSVDVWHLNVTPEGNINIPHVGVVNVSGKSVEQATVAIKSKLAANNYAIDKGTTVQVTLGDIRSIKIIITGEAVKPGTYTLPSLATVFNALYAAGGPSKNGSFRQIEVLRNNKIIRKLDVYDFLVKGLQNDNIGLKDQDIIRIPTYQTRVELSGEVKRPALYEMLPGETLKDLLNFGGGFTDLAYTANIQVLQITDNERSVDDIAEVDFSKHIPARGDKYVISRILNRYKNRVTINGAVMRPGIFALSKDLTLSKLIAKASGLRPDAFIPRGSITRLKPDNTYEILSFNVSDVINNPVADILLHREDSVVVSSIFDFKDLDLVMIKGEVRHPGNFAFADSMTIENLIIKAGGLRIGASQKRIEVSRRVDNSDPNSLNGNIATVYTIIVSDQLGLKSSNFILKPYDIVSVFSMPGFIVQRTVKIEGEVFYPGNYTITTKNEKISDLIAQAGGITPSGYPEGGALKRNSSTSFGFDKDKADTSALKRERQLRLSQLSRSQRDSSSIANEPAVNEFVGIDLSKILVDPNSKTNLILEDQDVLRIPKKLQTVKVNGEVLFPSAIVYSANESFKGYVLNAGGFSDDALKRKSYIVYPNGTVKGTRKFLFFNLYPEVKPGSEIYVSRKKAHRPVSVAEVLGITGALASIGLVIVTLINSK